MYTRNVSMELIPALSTLKSAMPGSIGITAERGIPKNSGVTSILAGSMIAVIARVPAMREMIAVFLDLLWR